MCTAVVDFLSHLFSCHRGAPDCSDPQECVICLDLLLANDKLVYLSCPARHCYHNACIQEWFAGSSQAQWLCPICQQPVNKFWRQ